MIAVLGANARRIFTRSFHALLRSSPHPSRTTNGRNTEMSCGLHSGRGLHKAVNRVRIPSISFFLPYAANTIRLKSSSIFEGESGPRQGQEKEEEALDVQTIRP